MKLSSWLIKLAACALRMWTLQHQQTTNVFTHTMATDTKADVKSSQQYKSDLDTHFRVTSQ